MKHRLLRTVALLLCAAHSLSHAATIRVPQDQPTIQEAIDFAVDGDFVSVAPGTYMERINFGGKQITVESTDGPEDTIIDGNFQGNVVFIGAGSTRDAVLRGFTITNGANSQEGGGITILNASPTVENNRISNNQAAFGAGIYLSGSDALIINNVIAGNRVQGIFAFKSGGGIHISSRSSPEIYDNLIAGNTAEEGGGIYIRGNTRELPIISRNIIANNSALRETTPADGGAIYVSTLIQPVISNNLIFDNLGRAGAAIWSTGAPTVVSNTIFNNDSLDLSTIALVGRTAGAVDGTFRNNIIVTPDGQTAVSCSNIIDTDQPVDIDFENNNVLAPNGTHFLGLCTDQTGTNGNLSVEPELANVTNDDFRLLPTSPMIDAALDDAAITIDQRNNPRSVDGNGDMVAASDIGALEASLPTANAGADVSVQTDANVALDGTSSADADGTIVTYLWSQTSGETVTLSDPEAAAPSFTAPGSATTLVFGLTVTDDLGFQDSDDISVTVTAPPPAPTPAPPSSSGGGGGGATSILGLLFFAALMWRRGVDALT